LQLQLHATLAEASHDLSKNYDRYFVEIYTTTVTDRQTDRQTDTTTPIIVLSRVDAW